MILPCGVLIMNSKVLKVFYGADNLPYKDKERVVHFPVVGGTFMGASNTTEIWFYFDKIGEPNNTWVAIAKLPNGKRGAVKLDTFNDDELNEPYAKLQLNTCFTQMRGDVYISLNGYDGGPILTKDPETGLYKVTGTPVIQATGSVKLTIQYATQLIGGEEIDEITLQEIYAMFGEKLDTNKGIVVIANTEVDIAQYDNGQYFYSKSNNSIYENVSGVLTLRFTAYSKTESNTLLATKVDKTTDTNIVYGTNNSGEQYKVPYSSDFSGKGNNLVQRDSNAQINVPTTPTDNNHATSKSYVDTKEQQAETYADTLGATKVDKTSSANKVYATDNSGNQTTISVDSFYEGNIVRRDSDNSITVPLTPTQNGYATSKKYVDNGLALKANQATTYTKTEVNNLIDNVKSGELEIVNTTTYPTLNDFLATSGEEGHIYLYPIDTTDLTKGYYRYVWEDISGTYQWVDLGTTEIDLSDYYTKTQTDTLLGGKQNTIDSSHKLSVDLTENGTTNKVFTATEQTKLSGIESGAQVNVLEVVQVDGVDLTITDKKVNITGKQNDVGLSVVSGKLCITYEE